MSLVRAITEAIDDLDAKDGERTSDWGLVIDRTQDTEKGWIMLEARFTPERLEAKLAAKLKELGYANVGPGLVAQAELLGKAMLDDLK